MGTFLLQPHHKQISRSSSQAINIQRISFLFKKGGGGEVWRFRFFFPFCCTRIHFVSLGYKQLEITLTACSISWSTHTHTHTHTAGDFNFNLWNCNCLFCKRQRIVGKLSMNSCVSLLFLFFKPFFFLSIYWFFVFFFRLLPLYLFSAFLCFCVLVHSWSFAPALSCAQICLSRGDEASWHGWH